LQTRGCAVRAIPSWHQRGRASRRQSRSRCPARAPGVAAAGADSRRPSRRAPAMTPTPSSRGHPLCMRSPQWYRAHRDHPLCARVRVAGRGDVMRLPVHRARARAHAYCAALVAPTRQTFERSGHGLPLVRDPQVPTREQRRQSWRCAAQSSARSRCRAASTAVRFGRAQQRPAPSRGRCRGPRATTMRGCRAQRRTRAGTGARTSSRRARAQAPGAFATSPQCQFALS